MKIKLIHPEHGTILSDAYPDDEAVRTEAMQSLRRCLVGENLSINMLLGGNLVVVPAEVVNKSIIVFVK